MTTWYMSNREVKKALLKNPGAYAEAVYIDGQWAGVRVMLPNPGYERELHELSAEQIRHMTGLPDTAVVETRRISTIELWAFHNSMKHGPGVN